MGGAGLPEGLEQDGLLLVEPPLPVEFPRLVQRGAEGLPRERALLEGLGAFRRRGGALRARGVRDAVRSRGLSGALRLLRPRAAAEEKDEDDDRGRAGEDSGDGREAPLAVDAVKGLDLHDVPFVTD